MIRIEIHGWQPGLMKVSHTQLLQEYAGLGLRDAHSATNHLLDGNVLSFEVSDCQMANTALKEFARIGAYARCSPASEPCA